MGRDENIAQGRQLEVFSRGAAGLTSKWTLSEEAGNCWLSNAFAFADLCFMLLITDLDTSIFVRVGGGEKRR